MAGIWLRLEGATATSRIRGRWGKPNHDLPAGNLNSILKQAGLKKCCEATISGFLNTHPSQLDSRFRGNDEKAIEMHLRGMREDGLPIPNPRVTWSISTYLHKLGTGNQPTAKTTWARN